MKPHWWINALTLFTQLASLLGWNPDAILSLSYISDHINS